MSDGINIDQEWVRQMVEATVPELPDAPTPEQCDAWIELATLLSDPSFIANMRANAGDVWDREAIDMKACQEASDAIVLRAKQAIEQGLEPSSAQANELARDWLEISARLMNQKPDAGFRNWMRTKYVRHDARANRYWELAAIMRGQPRTPAQTGNGCGSRLRCDIIWRPERACTARPGRPPAPAAMRSRGRCSIPALDVNAF